MWLLGLSFHISYYNVALIEINELFDRTHMALLSYSTIIRFSLTEHDYFLSSLILLFVCSLSIYLLAVASINRFVPHSTYNVPFVPYATLGAISVVLWPFYIFLSMSITILCNIVSVIFVESRKKFKMHC